MDKPELKETNNWLVLSILCYLTVMGGILYTLPRFIRMYDEMLAGEPLPTLTRVFCTIPIAVYGGVMILGVVTSVIIHLSTRSLTVRRGLCISIVLFSILLAIVYALATFSPLVRTGGLR